MRQVYNTTFDLRFLKVLDQSFVLHKMSEKLCLQWNDFKENAINAFGSLRDDNNFADVTFACEDVSRWKFTR